MDNPELYAENNLIGAVNILNAMAKSNVKALVFFFFGSGLRHARILAD